MIPPVEEASRRHCRLSRLADGWTGHSPDKKRLAEQMLSMLVRAGFQPGVAA